MAGIQELQQAPPAAPPAAMGGGYSLRALAAADLFAALHGNKEAQHEAKPVDMNPKTGNLAGALDASSLREEMVRGVMNTVQDGNTIKRLGASGQKREMPPDFQGRPLALSFFERENQAGYDASGRAGYDGVTAYTFDSEPKGLRLSSQPYLPRRTHRTKFGSTLSNKP